LNDIASNEEPIEEPVEPDKSLAAISVMRLIIGMLSREGMVFHPHITLRPIDSPTEYTMRMVSVLHNKKRDQIGMVRVWVIVSKIRDEIKVKIEWTRNAFGFWFTKLIIFKGEAKGTSSVKLADLRTVIGQIRQTTEGTVKLQSMIRTFKKVKKSTIKDRMVQVGLIRI
jgi:hypothetical protein